ncbi:hypothetical protein AB0O34_23620 [Sphaerisporangium sp. NPDC088356]|uniref:hypothetical protein n=1 Tax=Sphaerisporangium sp. NPDC088356 TaxID=3154871 RepID=UPI003439E199
MSPPDHTVSRTRPPAGRHLRTFTSLAAAGLVEAVLSSLGLVALVRMTGTEISGQVIFAQSVASVCFLLCDPRLDNTVQRYVPLEERRTGQGFALFTRLLRWDLTIRVSAIGVCLAVVMTARLLGFVSTDLALMLALAFVARGSLAANGAVRAAFPLANRLHDLGLLRLGCAILSFLLALAGLLAGGPLGYLIGQALGSVVTATVVGTLGTRRLRAEIGPSAAKVPIPAGLVAFTVKATTGTALAEVSDSGILTVAGLLGGSTLVTIIKIASAPGRLYSTLVMPVASMLHPRLARAAAAGEERTLARRDLMRATALLTVAGVLTLLLVLPVIGDALRLVYGREYTGIGAVAALLVAAACVKGMVCWSNVLPLALGRPGWRLAYLAAEGVLLLGALLIADLTSSGALHTALSFAWGTLLVSVLGTGVWMALLQRISAPAGDRADTAAEHCAVHTRR